MNESVTGATAFLRQFPALAARLPHTPIGVFPTPLRVLPELPRELGTVESLYAKDDGVSSPIYGGNKVRKLELVLGEALDRGAREGIRLDPAYTGKTLACLVADSRRGALAGKHVLVWNTSNAADLSALSARATRERLPPGLHAYLPRP